MKRDRMYKSRSPSHRPTEAIDSDKKKSLSRAREAEQVREEIDELLDEIEDVLAENAEEFVDNFVQHGGE